MATTTIVVLVGGILGTVLAVAFVGLVLVQRIMRAYGEATRVMGLLQPTLADLAEQQQVTTRELERVGHAVDLLREERDARRRG